MNVRSNPENFKPASEDELAFLVKEFGEAKCLELVTALGLDPDHAEDWTPEERTSLAQALQAIAKPKTLHQAALNYAAKGWPVFPCLPGAKEPATPRGFKDATTDTAQINAWWTENSDYNVAFEPEQGGLCVIDADAYHEGCNVAALNLPPTYEVQTPRGGTHFYFVGSLPTSVGDATKPDKGLGPFIDTRGRGSYVLLPPSVTEHGLYKVTADRPIEILPFEIEDKLAQQQRDPAKATVRELDLPGNIERGRTRLADLVKQNRVAVEGQRGHDTTYEVACELVRDLGVSAELALNLMLEIWYPHCIPNDQPGFVRDRVNSAARNGQNEPGAFATAPAAEVFAGAEAVKYATRETRAGDNGAPPDGITAEQWDRMLEKYRPRDPVEEANRPPLTFYDKEHLWPLSPEGAVGFVYGDTGTHKTGFALSKAIDLVFNHPTKPRVAFFAGEGAYAFGQSRVPAMCKHYGKTVEELRDTGRFHQISAVPLLNSADEMQAVRHQLDKFRPNIIIIETFSRAIVGRYNAPDFVGQAYDTLDEMRSTYRALVSVSHHEGKDASRGPMGSSQVTTHSDFVLYLEKVTANTIQVTVEKMRDGEDDFNVGYEVLRYNGVPVLAPVSGEELEQAKKNGAHSIDPENMAFRDRVVKFLRDNGYNDHIHKSIETKFLAEQLITPPVRGGNTATNNKAEYEWEIEVNKMATRLKNSATRGSGKRKSGVLSDLVEKHCRPGGAREFYFWAVRNGSQGVGE